MRPSIEKAETQKQTLEPTGLAKPGKTRALTGSGSGLARQDTAGRVLGRFWNRTERYFWAETGLLAGYPDPLLPLLTTVVLAVEVVRVMRCVRLPL